MVQFAYTEKIEMTVFSTLQSYSECQFSTYACSDYLRITALQSVISELNVLNILMTLKCLIFSTSIISTSYSYTCSHS